MVCTLEGYGGYGLYDSTLRQPFNVPYMLTCLERRKTSTRHLRRGEV